MKHFLRLLLFLFLVWVLVSHVDIINHNMLPDQGSPAPWNFYNIIF